MDVGMLFQWVAPKLEAALSGDMMENIAEMFMQG